MYVVSSSERAGFIFFFPKLSNEINFCKRKQNKTAICNSIYIVYIYIYRVNYILANLFTSIKIIVTHNDGFNQ